MSLPFGSSPAAAAATADRQMPPALWAIPQTIQQQPQHHQSRSPPQFKQNQAPRMKVKGDKGRGSSKGEGEGSGAAKAREDELKAEPCIKGKHVCTGSTGQGMLCGDPHPAIRCDNPRILKRGRSFGYLAAEPPEEEAFSVAEGDICPKLWFYIVGSMRR